MHCTRTALAALVATVVLFAWQAVAHMATPLGMMGMQELPMQPMFEPIFRDSIPASGMYYFPGMPKCDAGPEFDAWLKLYETSPNGVLLINPKGSKMMGPETYLNGFACDYAAVLVMAMILSALKLPWCKAAGVGFGLGFFAWVYMDAGGYGNWWGFPRDMMIASGIMHTVGWTLAGAVCGLALPKGSKCTQTGTCA